ncbi:MAG: glycine cleavage system protein GcvH [candidate division WOR-3 bacterium]|nr:glycine cleavage system protein GcvH [candidate division WOR-3 bacterium]
MADTLIPKELKYTKTHEWLKLDGDIGIIGITDYAQHELSDIVYVDLPEVNKNVAQGDVLGSIEAVKAVTDFYSPISGIVIEINSELKSAPELVNKDPYQKGWLVKIKISNPDELKNLLDADGYQQLISSQQ